MVRPAYDELVACLRMLGGHDGTNDYNCAECCCDVESMGHVADCRIGQLLGRIDGPGEGEGDDRVVALEQRVEALSAKVDGMGKLVARLGKS